MHLQVNSQARASHSHCGAKGSSTFDRSLVASALGATAVSPLLQMSESRQSGLSGELRPWSLVTVRLTMFQQMHGATRHFTAGYFDPPRRFCRLISTSGNFLFWRCNCTPNRMKRAIALARRGDSDEVSLYIHDGAASVHFEIEGCLSGNAAPQVGTGVVDCFVRDGRPASRSCHW